MAGARSNVEEIVPVTDLFPWQVVEFPHRPFQGFWSMNPSIHVEPDGTWICNLRCVDYSMFDGKVTLSARAKPSVRQTINAIVTLDPKTWKPIKTYPVHESDDLPRAVHCANTGYEDIRLFRTAAGGLQGIGASLHLERARQVVGGSNPPEQVLLSLDANYDIIAARPIRGSWSSTPQKNWMPFDGADEPRFLFSIDRGTVFDVEGPLNPQPSTAPIISRPRNLGTTEVRVFKSPRPVSAGRVSPPSYGGIRGGTQLIPVADGLWLGAGHEMRHTHGRKFYWHTFFTVGDDGQLVAKSRPVKIATENIEFAAGMAREGDRLVVSYGVEDGMCRLAETSLDAVLASLQPLVEESSDPMPPLRRDESVMVAPLKAAPRVVSVAAGSPSSQRDAHPSMRSSSRVGSLVTAVASAQAAQVARANPTANIPTANGHTNGTGDELLAAAAELARQRRDGTPELQREAWARCIAAIDAHGATTLMPLTLHDEVTKPGGAG